MRVSCPELLEIENLALEMLRADACESQIGEIASCTQSSPPHAAL